MIVEQTRKADSLLGVENSQLTPGRRLPLGAAEGVIGGTFGHMGSAVSNHKGAEGSRLRPEATNGEDCSMPIAG
jgi:hypothetical protein